MSLTLQQREADDGISCQFRFGAAGQRDGPVRSLVATLAVAGPDEKLLVGRDAHKSVISGLILAGIRPIWVEPAWGPEPGPSPVRGSVRRQARCASRRAGGAGHQPDTVWTCADLAAIAEVCHARGRPLITDEAWRAHLPFHDGLPAWAMNAGADVCVTSVHKMGAGLEQSSVFHLQGDLVDPAVCRPELTCLAPPARRF
jgi:arginine decarboxylase